jgi:hypothetical protein
MRGLAVKLGLGCNGVRIEEHGLVLLSVRTQAVSVPVRDRMLYKIKNIASKFSISIARSMRQKIKTVGKSGSP